MDQIISLFHVDIQMLLAQFVNFGITFVILYFFVIKPLVKLMDDRTARIAQGVEHAESMEERVAALEEDRKEVLAKARKQAQEIIAESKVQAEQKRDESLEKTREEVKRIIGDAKKDIERSRKEMVESVQKETISLVYELASKVLGESLSDKKIDKKYIEKQLTKVAK